MLDLAGLDILYYSIIQCRPPSTADSIAIIEMELVLSTRPVAEQIESQLESTSEPVSIPPVPSAAATTDLTEPKLTNIIC